MPAIARAQDDDPVEVLRRYSVDPSIVQPGAVELGKKMLAWQIEQGTHSIQRMEEGIKELERKVENLEERMSALATKGMGAYAFTSDTVRAQLIGRVLERLLDVQVDIAAEKEVVAYLEDGLNKHAAKDDLGTKFKAQRDVLLSKLATLHRERDRLKKLHENKAASQAELLKSTVTIQTLQAEIAALDVQKASANREHAADVAMPLSEARIKLLERRARERVAEKQLTEITSAASFAVKIRQMQRELDRLNSTLDIRFGRMQEKELEIEESQTLLELTEAKLKQHAVQTATPNGD